MTPWACKKNHAWRGILCAIAIAAAGCHSQRYGEGCYTGVAGAPPDPRQIAITPPAAMSPSRVLEVRVHVVPAREEAINSHVGKMVTAGHPQEGKAITPEQYRAKFGLSDKDAARVRAHLESCGLDVHDYLAAHTLKVSGPAAAFERAFDVQMVTFKAPGDADGFGAIGLPRLPDGYPEVRVDGLFHRPDKKHHIQFAGQSERKGPAWLSLPHKNVMPVQGLTAEAIREAYNVPGDWTGKGQRVAVLQLDGYNAADIDAYAVAMGIRRVPTRNIRLNGFDGKPYDNMGQLEATLDIELLNAMAPGLEEIVVYQTRNSYHGLTDLLHRLANPLPGEPLVSVATLSWGSPESVLSYAEAGQTCSVLRQLATQGQTVFVAAGDLGSKADGKTMGTDDPASQPFAVAVGGTTLVTSAGKWLRETTWPGGGGGISRFWASPSWQRNTEGPGAKGSLTMRDVPDVALNSDPATGYACLIDVWHLLGGTSCAAPLWAGFIALANEARAAQGKLPLGFIPPTLYGVAATPQGRAGFHDIADNSTNGYYPAVSGLDDATGWGTLNAAPLLDALVAWP